jgi:hypothetical protein
MKYFHPKIQFVLIPAGLNARDKSATFCPAGQCETNPGHPKGVV